VADSLPKLWRSLSLLSWTRTPRPDAHPITAWDPQRIERFIAEDLHRAVQNQLTSCAFTFN
jgi:hypothetical protein